MKITYLGQCGFLLEDKDTRIVTDPYFSDAVDREPHSDGKPWKRQYPAPYTLSQLSPDAILISHDHTDHLDPLTLKDFADCPVCAPLPVCHELEALNVKQIVPCRADAPFTVKNATVTPIPCAHTQLQLDDEGHFFQLSYIVDFGGFKVFFAGDMSLYDGLAKRLSEEKLSLMLLPINGRDEERTRHNIIGNITHEEAALLSKALDVPYIPMHHDLYLENGCEEALAIAAAKEAGSTICPMKPAQTLTF